MATRHTLHNTLETSAPPEALWSIVGNLAGAAAWIPGIASVSVEPLDASGRQATRMCTFADGSVQHERIDDYSPAERSYRYDIKGGPMPLVFNQGRLTVRATPGGAQLVWDAEIEPADASMAAQLVPMLDGAYKQVLEGLRKLVEEKATAGAAMG